MKTNKYKGKKEMFYQHLKKELTIYELKKQTCKSTSISVNKSEDLMRMGTKINEEFTILMNEINIMEEKPKKYSKVSQAYKNHEESSTQYLGKAHDLATKLLAVVEYWNDDRYAMDALSALEEYDDKILSYPIHSEENLQITKPVFQSKTNLCRIDKEKSQDDYRSSRLADLISICQNLMKEREILLSEIIKMKKSYEITNIASCNAVIAKTSKKIAIANIECEIKRKKLCFTLLSILNEERKKAAKMKAFYKWRLWILSQKVEK